MGIEILLGASIYLPFSIKPQKKAISTAAQRPTRFIKEVNHHNVYITSLIRTMI